MQSYHSNNYSRVFNMNWKDEWHCTLILKYDHFSTLMKVNDLHMFILNSLNFNFNINEKLYSTKCLINKYTEEQKEKFILFFLYERMTEDKINNFLFFLNLHCFYPNAFVNRRWLSDDWMVKWQLNIW